METQFLCRHIFTEGRRCKAICLRSEEFCYFHHANRPKPQRKPREGFTLPPIEDRAALQVALDQIIARIADGSLDPRRAGLLLYALQLASSNLPKPILAQEPEPTVEEITHDPTLGTLAPRGEYGIPPPPKLYQGRTLEQIILYDLEGNYNPPPPRTPATIDLNASEDPAIDLNAAATPATTEINATANSTQPPTQTPVILSKAKHPCIGFRQKASPKLDLHPQIHHPPLNHSPHPRQLPPA